MGNYPSYYSDPSGSEDNHSSSPSVTITTYPLIVKKVLILCQRKEDPEDPDLVETNTALENFVFQFFPEDQKELQFDYLSALVASPTSSFGRNSSYRKAKVDFNIKFEDNEPTRSFVESHRKVYSAVVLQTCPFIILAESEKTAKFLSEIMTDDGVLIATAITKENKKNLKSANIAGTVLKGFSVGRGFDSASWKKYFKVVFLDGDEIAFKKRELFPKS